MRRPTRAILPAAVLPLLAACSAGGDGGAGNDTTPPSPAVSVVAAGAALTLTLGSERVAPGDSIPIALHVVNGTAEPLVLEFTSGQRYDLWVAPAGGEPIWTWSADKLFMQMLSEETIAPGDTLEYRDIVPAPVEPGEYRVIAAVTSSNRELADTAAVTVGP